MTDWMSDCIEDKYNQIINGNTVAIDDAWFMKSHEMKVVKLKAFIYDFTQMVANVFCGFNYVCSGMCKYVTCIYIQTYAKNV